MKQLHLVKYDEFINVAKVLNQNSIIPLLFGSLGLGLRLTPDYDIDDIDILVNEIFINEKWDELQAIVESMGYLLEDLHEHQFRKDDMKIAFASLEGLESFAGIDIGSIELMQVNNARYLLLDLTQYLEVYKSSSKDSYRKDKNNNKDAAKIVLIESNL